MTNDDSKVARCRRLAKFRQYLAAFLVSLLGFCLGNGLGWPSPVQPLLQSEHPPVGSEPFSLNMIAWLGSIIYIGSIFGTLFWGTAVDRLGRKTSACLVAVPHIISWVLILVAKNAAWLLVARFIMGVGLSGSLITGIVFISEIAQDDLRGFLVYFIVIFISIGILYAYTAGAYLGYYGLGICCLIIPFIFLLTFTWLPETPQYLWKNGKIIKAKQSLLWYRGGDTVEMENTLMKYKAMPTTVGRKGTFKSLFATRGTIKALIIGCTLTISNQACGAFTVLNFATYIFQICGTSLTPYQSANIVAATQLVSSLFFSFLVDRLGRKFLLIGSLLIMTFTLGLLGVYLLFFKSANTDSVLNWIPVVLLSLHIVAFAGGLGPITNIIKGEIFPPEVRGLAISQLQLVNALIAFTMINIFPFLKNVLNMYGCFWVYSCFCLCFAIFFTIYLPETKNKPQSYILKILNGEDVNTDFTLDEANQLQEKPEQSLNVLAT